MEKTAIVFGATGLTGSYLLRELTQIEYYSKIKVFNRSLQQYSHPKIEEILTDYNKLSEYSDKLTGNDVYCCLGTTLKKAGSKEQFVAIDHGLPVEIATICLKNKCKTFVVISSVGANSKSNNYYLKTKGRMEEDILKLGFDYCAFVRPSMLLGNRNESRLGETIGKVIMNVFGFLLIGKLKKYKAIHAVTVARAMINILKQSEKFSSVKKNIFESNELTAIAENKLL